MWELAAENPPPTALRAGEGLMNIAQSANGQYVAILGQKNDGMEIRVWDVFSDRCTHSEAIWRLSTRFLSYVCLSNDGHHLLAVGPETQIGRGQAVAEVWDASNGRSIRLATDGLGTVRFAAFSPDGKFVLTASEPPSKSAPTADAALATATASAESPKWQVQVWNVGTGGRLLATL